MNTPHIVARCCWPLVTCAALCNAAEPATRLIEEVVVIAHPLSGEGLAQASTVLQGDALQQQLAGNIATTLGTEPGIHAASFGSAAGRPVIHGLGGPRIRIMEDRIDALDVSVTSADHATMVEPFIADRIEVLKGSAALLYGTGAIGGVVDVHTGRIPHDVPEANIEGGLESRYDTNADGQTTAVKFKGGGGRFAVHVDGTLRDGNDYDIPGFAESAAQRRAEAGEEGEEEGEHEGEEAVRDTLPGTGFDSRAGAIGASYIAPWGFVGAAVSRYSGDYGLPGGHGHEEEEGEEAEAEFPADATPILELEQQRLDFELGIESPFAQFTSLNLRLGVNDYEHQEIEPSGEVATQFENDAWELRGELTYAGTQWDGVFGLQHTERDFSAVGEEAFVPPVESRNSAIFWVGERDFAAFDLETGLRVGEVEHRPSQGRDRTFTTYAGSIGIVLPFAERWQLGALLDYSARAPIGEELFSNGPHLATNSFEIGDPDLDSERAASFSSTLTFAGERWSGSATAYYMQFRNFIYERATGAVLDELPVFQFTQEDARFVGVDLEVSTLLQQWDGGELTLHGQLDAVRARLDVRGDADLPRIPPLRYGAGLRLKSAVAHGTLRASLEYLRTTRQDQIAATEFATPGYDDLRAFIGYDLALGNSTLGLFVTGRNLTDAEQRSHTSFIKDRAPEPGRTIEAGVRLLF